MTKRQLESRAQKLEKIFPGIKGIRVESGCIHLGDAAEGGVIDEVYPAADYYSEDYAEKTYVFGVHRKLGNALQKMGMMTEWECAGILKAFPE